MIFIRHQFTKVALLLLIVALYCFVLTNYRLDPDFGWHLRSGQTILAGSIPSHDIFTYTAKDFPWVNHEWLVDAGIAKLYSLGGYGAVAGVFALLWATAIVFATRRYQWIVIAIAALGTAPYIGIRPVALTVLFFVLLERLLEQRHRRVVWLAVPIMLLWANVHAGFVLGLGLLWLYAFMQRQQISWTIPLVATIVTLINPYGSGLYTELLRTLGDSALHVRVVEWLPLYVTYPTQVYVVFFIAAYWLTNEHKWRNSISVPGALFVAMLSSTRHAPLFIASSARYFEHAIDRLRALLPSPLQPTQRRVFTILLVIVVGIIGYGLFSTVKLSPDREAAYPKAIAAELQRHPCTGNLYNAYTVGGYLIWKVPNQLVYIDGRMPSWKFQGVDYYANYLHVQSDADFRRAEFTRYNITCVVWPANQPAPRGIEAKLQAWLFGAAPAVSFTEQLQNEGWTSVMSSNGYTLFTKSAD